MKNRHDYENNRDEFQVLVENCKAKAIAGKLEPSEESLYRSYCREFSVVFNTPLYQVFKELDPHFVILSVMEHHLEDADPVENMEELLDQIYILQDPDYNKTKRDEVKAFIKEAEEEEAKRIAAGRPIHKDLLEEVSTKGTTPVQTPTQPTKLPQSGGVNLAYLEREENGSNTEEF